MAQPLSKEVLDSAVDPAVLREQSFDVARRGYNQRQVREYLGAAADALLEAKTREDSIRRRLGKAVRRAEVAEQKLRDVAPVEVDDTARQVGDEVASVLEAARLAADQSVAAAKDEAAKILDAAKSEATEIRRSAEAEVISTRSQLLSEGQAEVQALREQARSDADAMLAQAATRVEQARNEGDNLIQEATEARAQILEDMEQRRRKARVQVERLRVGRDRLLRSYELVRRTLDETTGELKISLKEAKVRGDGAARTVASQPLATRDELEEELRGAQLIGRSAALPRPLTGTNQAAGVSDLADAKLAQAKRSPQPRKPVVTQGQRSPVPAQPKAPAFAPVLTPASAESPDLATTAAQADTAAPVSAPSASEEAELEAGVDVAAEVVLAADPDGDVIDITDEALAAELAELADDDLNVVEPSDEIEEVRAIPVEGAATAEATETTAEAAEATEAGTGLFAALRAQRSDAAPKKAEARKKQAGAKKQEAEAKKQAGAKQAGAKKKEAAAKRQAGAKQAGAKKKEAAAKRQPGAKQAGAKTPAQPAQPAVDLVDSGDDQVDAPRVPDAAPAPSQSRFPGIAAQRDAVIADAAKQLEKRLKRALADEQNELLAGLRKGRRKKRIELAGLVGDPDKQLSRYVTAINEVAAVTYGAGAALIDVEIEHGQLPAGAVEELLVADVVSPIRDQLETLDRMDVASSDMHVDPVRSFYRQTKTDHLGDAATRLAHLLCVAGVCDALPAQAPLPWEATAN